jgi:hypothetical protein
MIGTGLLSFPIGGWVSVSCLASFAICSLQVRNLTTGDVSVEILLHNIFVCEEKIQFPFSIRHYDAMSNEQAVVVLTYKDGLEEDFDHSQY